MGGKDRARIAIYAMGGIYLLVLVYNMLSNLGDVVTTSERTLSVIFIVVFALAGLGMVGLGIWDMHRNYKKYKEDYYAAATEIDEEKEEQTEEILDKD